MPQNILISAEANEIVLATERLQGPGWLPTGGRCLGRSGSPGPGLVFRGPGSSLGPRGLGGCAPWGRPLSPCGPWSAQRSWTRRGGVSERTWLLGPGGYETFTEIWGPTLRRDVRQTSGYFVRAEKMRTRPRAPAGPGLHRLLRLHWGRTCTERWAGPGRCLPPIMSPA